MVIFWRTKKTKAIENLFMGYVFFLLIIGALFRIFSETQYSGNVRPWNSQKIYEDSVRVVGTGSYTLPIIWQDNNPQKALLIEARDDSSAGFSGDSCDVKITAYQVFPFTSASGKDVAVRLNSRANPDSTTKLGSSVYNIFDSLNIALMDTAACYLRNRIAQQNVSGAAITIPGDTLKTLQTTGFGAFAYISLTPLMWNDFSPAIAITVKGLGGNLKRGVGSMWKFRVFAIKGNKMTGGN